MAFDTPGTAPAVVYPIRGGGDIPAFPPSASAVRTSAPVGKSIQSLNVSQTVRNVDVGHEATASGSVGKVQRFRAEPFKSGVGRGSEPNNDSSNAGSNDSEGSEDPTKAPLFSRIFYEKGASVNRMVMTVLGKDAW
jgi:hypothetical protein